ncbi:MAG: GTP cyclohydrolase I FolE [Opitutaceae bacterium]|nr:GTP cyclohydrolase I FolE [Cytophagales bacterium]
MENNDHEQIEAHGDDHLHFTNDTPMKKGAFDIDDESKIAKIETHFKEIMEILGLDLSDDSLHGTPRRVAKMYVKEMFWGLNPENKPSISHFKNKFKYNEMLIEKDISFYTNCEHHFVPFFGKAHIAYIPNGKVVGLSKLNRIVEYYAKRPQVQERLTMQIANELKNALNTEDVAVIINAKHLCVASRGIKDDTSNTTTAEYGGKFSESKTMEEFHRLLMF